MEDFISYSKIAELLTKALMKNGKCWSGGDMRRRCMRRFTGGSIRRSFWRSIRSIGSRGRLQRRGGGYMSAIAAAGAAALINMPAANITIAFCFILNFILFISYYFMYLNFTQKSAAFIFRTPFSTHSVSSCHFPVQPPAASPFQKYDETAQSRAPPARQHRPFQCRFPPVFPQTKAP